LVVGPIVKDELVVGILSGVVLVADVLDARNAVSLNRKMFRPLIVVRLQSGRSKFSLKVATEAELGDNVERECCCGTRRASKPEPAAVPLSTDVSQGLDRETAQTPEREGRTAD
jgi:hypothetical protein